MRVNVGTVDRGLRVVVGVALLGFFALNDSAMHWFGLLGLVPLVTAALGNCPAYTLLGISTCPMKR